MSAGGRARRNQQVLQQGGYLGTGVQKGSLRGMARG